MPDAEVQLHIAEAYEHLHEYAATCGTRLFEATQSISSTGAASYALPSDHMHTKIVEYLLSPAGVEKIQLPELMTQERTRFSLITGDRALRYAIEGTNIALYPTPPSGQTYNHLYVAQPTDYTTVATSTSVDFLCSAGARYVQWAAAANCLAKEESDSSFQVLQREKSWERFMAWCNNRSLMTYRRQVHEDDAKVFEFVGEYSDRGW